MGHSAGPSSNAAGGLSPDPAEAASVMGHWADHGGKDAGDDGGGGGGEAGHEHEHHPGDEEVGGMGDGDHNTPGHQPGPAGAAAGARGPVETENDGSLGGIRPGVHLTAAITAGYRLLRPYLPGGTVMTSGLRTNADQIRIINDYFRRRGGPASITDVEQRRVWLTRRGMKIARVGSSPHLTGLAFDLSGAGLGSIRAAVNRCRAEKPGFHLAGTILESANNCVHVNLSA